MWWSGVVSFHFVECRSLSTETGVCSMERLHENESERESEDEITTKANRTSTCPHTGLQLVRTQDFNLSAHRTSTCPHTGLDITQNFNLSAHKTSTCLHTGLQLVRTRTQIFNLSAHRTSTCPHTGLQLVTMMKSSTCHTLSHCALQDVLVKENRLWL